MNDNLNNLKDIFARLAIPFNPEDIEWRAGATNADKTKALALTYLTSRAVMDRLDEVIGPENWRDEYKPGPDGGVICGLSLRIDGEWITKWDGADNTDIEAIKGGLSDAFKRVGVKWGIGRYLYRLESTWVSCEAHGKSVSLKSTPPLPSWALPPDVKSRIKWQTTEKPKAEPVVEPTVQTPSEEPPKSPEPADRTTQIMQELGFKPEPAKESPVSSSGNNGKNGSTKAATSKAALVRRLISWNADVVLAILDHNLAKTAPEAVALLNHSDLPANSTPDQAVAALQNN